jgi:hypothetical protein
MVFVPPSFLKKAVFNFFIKKIPVFHQSTPPLPGQSTRCPAGSLRLGSAFAGCVSKPLRFKSGSNGFCPDEIMRIIIKEESVSSIWTGV